MKKILVFFIMLIMVGCSGEENNASDVNGFGSFSYRGVTIEMNAEADAVVTALEALGEPVSYFEMESCAFQGLDKIYTYSSFELYTYPNDGKDYILSVVFMDDTVTTTEGLKLGSSLSDVLSKYGDNYEETFGVYTYTVQDTSLSFMIENDTTVSIEYTALY